MGNLNWVYIFMVFVELAAIFKFILIWNRFVDHTLIKTLLLITKSLVRCVIFFLIVTSSAEINWFDRSGITYPVRVGWFLVGITMLTFHIFDFLTIAKIARKQKDQGQTRAIWGRVTD